MTFTGTLSEARLDSLKRGNEIRLRRMVERRRLKALDYRLGRRVIAAWLLSPPDWMLGATLLDVLCWPRRQGRANAIRTLRAALTFPPNELAKVRDLTERQRKLIAESLRRSA